MTQWVKNLTAVARVAVKGGPIPGPEFPYATGADKKKKKITRDGRSRCYVSPGVKQ